MTTQPPGVTCATEKLEVTPRLAGFNLMAVLAVTAILLLWLDPASRPTAAGRFLGRFHPALVHLPIGLLALALGLDLAARLGRCTMDWARWTYVAASWTGVGAVAAGLWLAQAGGYDAQTLFLHRLSGVIVTVGAASVPWVQSALWSRGIPDGVVLLFTGLVGAFLVVGGHQGGVLTHGPDYLSAHAPPFLKAALGDAGTGTRFRFGDPDTTTVFGAVVQPILEQRCVSCHGAGRTRGGLDLRTAASLADGSEDGPVVVAGRPDQSPLVARVHLPEGSDKRMPPDDAAPLSPADARLLAWWVGEASASFDTVIAETEIPADVRGILDAAGLGEVRTGVWALDVQAAEAGRLSALTALGAVVRPVAENEPFLSVRCDSAAACFSDDGEALAALAEQVVWLDLARSDVTDEDLAFLGPLGHLERLWLQKTSIDGTGLIALSSAPYLSYLNVSETRTTAAALEAVGHAASVYAWGSPADAEMNATQ